jgi:O-antigen/teichoic acid export membrane protein
LSQALLDRVAALPSSQLARNVGANALAVGWNGLLIVLVTPWYVSILGMEGYGLVGFWVLLQVVVSLLDLGMGATLVREFASVQGIPDGNRRRRDLLRTLEWVYWPLAACLAVLLFAASGWIAGAWLKLQTLSSDQVARSIGWMALALGMQLPGALYSSGLVGLQKQGRLAFLQIAGNSLRHGGGLAVLLWRGDPASYFLVQALASGVQTVATHATLSQVLSDADKARPAFRAALLREAWRFSAGMATTTAAAVLLGNVDRLFLSTMLPAAELGRYTVAWAATGLLQLGIQPFYRAYFPRFTELLALGDHVTLRQEYYEGCRIVARVVIPTALIGWMFAPEIFRAWVGNADRTTVVAFRLLLVGVACAGLMWLPVGLQHAHGWTRLHAVMIIGALAIGAASLWWTIRYWGAVGATSVWLLHGISNLTIGLWLMHRRLLPGELGRWWRVVVLPPLLCCVPVVGGSCLAMPPELGRWSVALWLGATGVAAMASLLLLSEDAGTEPAPAR